jgi:hypothetical protein
MDARWTLGDYPKAKRENFMFRTLFTTVRVAAGLATLTLLMSNPATAKTVFPIGGGSGDAGFQDHCPANQYLTGIAGRTGTVVDQIQIICSPLRADGTHGASYYGPLRGGGGGAAQEFSCSADSFVTGAVIYWNDKNNMVTTVNLNCSASRAHGVSLIGLQSGNESTLFLHQDEECPTGELATGFAGRYGKNVNALGLFCDASTVASAPVASAAPSAYPIRTTGKVAGSTSTLGNSAGCPQGLFWREASPTDHVCVNAGQHLLTLQENKAGPSHISQTDHTFGPNTCAQGYVWRAAFNGDAVCVTPQQRDEAAAENKFSAGLPVSH